ncbi:hypothetical protein [Sphingomonas sp. TREG-RG-20F-R18-01]|uniref:hypothetical protein n=1 Tax=Sphingomonas sp. TREG-RG-20F-R18-01 TaxID=2914982 RepID=UPI001F567E73|nr:hypothetical protein [Sphingomonas sp. TREG-RG-20F-R18-01]
MAAEAGNLDQVLVAATLVAASLAVLFVVWQADVAAALALKPNIGGNANDGESRATVRWVLFTRSLPLLATAITTFLILLHQIAPILQEVGRCMRKACTFDDAKALAVVNVAVVGLLVLGLFGQLVSHCVKWRRLGGFAWLINKKPKAG